MFQDYVLYGLKLWCIRLVPTLFPFMVLTSIFWAVYDQRNCQKNSTLLTALGKMWHLSPKNIYILLFGLLCGYPSGAAVISKRYKQNELTKNEANYLISICNQSSPAFISAYFINYILEAKEKQFLIFLILYCGIYLTSLFTRYIYRTSNLQLHPEYSTSPAFKKGRNSSFFQILDQAVKEGINTCLMIAGYMILCSASIGFIINTFSYFSPYHSIAASFMEITYGLSALKDSALTDHTKEMLLIPLFSFGGICTMAQIKGMFVGTSLSIKPYLIGKSIYTVILWMLFKLLI